MIPPPEVDERGWWAEQIWIPWIESARRLDDAVVVEYGCGSGSVSRVFAPRVKRHIGLDIDEDHISVCRDLGRNQPNAEFHCHPPAEIIDVLLELEGQVDVLLLYAVLEHMTSPECLAVLRAARQVTRPNGVIVVTESPNRLSEFDHHSSWVPYVNQLPPPLALEYLATVATVPRPEFSGHVLAHRDESVPIAQDESALLALQRFGRGISFHEFELAWGTDLHDSILASSWDPTVAPHREVHPGELAVARSLARRRPDIDPAWGRQWLDFVLSPDPVPRRTAKWRPWIGYPGAASSNVQFGQADAIRLPHRDSALHVQLPEATRFIACHVIDGDTRSVATVEMLGGTTVKGSQTGTPNRPRVVMAELPSWTDDVLIQLEKPGWITAVLYRGYGP